MKKISLAVVFLLAHEFGLGNDLVSVYSKNRLMIPTLIAEEQSFRNVVFQQHDDGNFSLIEFTPDNTLTTGFAASYLAGSLSIKYLQVGEANYSDVFFRISDSLQAELIKFTGPHNILTFVESNFRLREPEYWETSEITFDTNSGTYEGRSARFLGSLPIIDVDRDGYKDVLIPGTLWDANGWVNEKTPIYWLRNLGNMSFEAGVETAIPESAARIHHFTSHVIDLNGDGIDDFVSAASGWDKPPWAGEPNLLLLSNPDGSFRDASFNDPAFDYMGFTHNVEVGDVNNDNNIDIVFADIGGDDVIAANKYIRILLNDGAGNFLDRGSFPLSTAEDLATLAVALVDLNGDLYEDLVIGALASRNNPSLYRLEDRVYWNNGSGFFDTSNYTSLPVHEPGWGETVTDTLSILVTDFDHDGVPDLVFQKHKDYQIGVVQFIRTLPDGGFVDETSSYSPLTQYQTKWGHELKDIDINKDGYTDIVFERESEGDPLDIFNHVWLRDKNGGFVEFSNFEAGIGDGWFWYLDLDEDGDIDLVRRKSSLFNSINSGILDKRFEWSVFENRVISDYDR